MFQICGSATLLEPERTNNTSEGSDGHSGACTAPIARESILSSLVYRRKASNAIDAVHVLRGRGRTILLEYTYAGQLPDVKQQIVKMAMNASGIRDTARVLHVSPTTVIKELKNKEPHLHQGNHAVLQHVNPAQSRWRFVGSRNLLNVVG
jgi:hypothetical protein